LNGSCGELSSFVLCGSLVAKNSGFESKQAPGFVAHGKSVVPARLPVNPAGVFRIKGSAKPAAGKGDQQPA
jgi:hypothetical protein